MKLTEADKDLIDKYFDGSLKEEEKLIFEQKIKNSTPFAQEVELHKTMFAAIRMRDEQQLRQELKSEALKLRQKSSGSIYHKYFYLATASVAVLAISFYLILPSNHSLYEEYYVVFPENPIVRSENISKNDFELAMNAYSKGQFQNALQLLNKLGDAAIKDEVALYKGNCYLNVDQPKKAITQFQLALGSSNTQIVFQAQWFLALAHLKNGDQANTTEVLLQIQSSQHPYKEKSEALMNKLNWAFY